MNGPFMNDDFDTYFGASLALAHDGGLMIGCPGENNFTRALYYDTYVITCSEYVLKQKITTSGGAPGDTLTMLIKPV